MEDLQAMEGLCGGNRKTGGKCRKPAGWGTGHLGVGRCSLHLGSTPTHELSGQVQLARREMAVMGIPLDIEAQDAILECIRIAAGEVAYASDCIAELEAFEAVGPVVTTIERSEGSSETAENAGPVASGLWLPRGASDERAEAEQARYANVADAAPARFEERRGPPALHVWIQVRHQAMDRLAAYSTAALRNGVQERLVAVAESQAQLLAQAVRGILTELGVADNPEAAAVVRKHLTLISRTAA